MKTVGIIGGLGPETTAEFYMGIVFSCQEKNRVHRPLIVVSSVPLPYAIENDAISKNKGFEKILPFLVKEAKRLEKAGADFIVMPCNSLHVFIGKIEKSVKIPVLNIIEETVKFLKLNNMKKVGIVSTPATIQNKLYENYFRKNDITYIAPDNFQQVMLGKMILNIVSGKQNGKDKKELVKIIDSLKKKGAECVVLACTDLQLLNPKHPKLRIFDTMKIFADATVKKMLK